MNRIRHLGRRFLQWLGQSRGAGEIEDELAFHIRMETQQNLDAGMEPAAARRAAHLAFGGLDRFTETARDAGRGRWTRDLFQDGRHAARALRRSPGFTAAAVLTLALGVGANTAVFAVVHAVLLRPLPYAEPDRLVWIWESAEAEPGTRGPVSPGTFVDLRARSRTLEQVALFGHQSILVTDGASAWQAVRASVSPEFFDVLGVAPLLGRGFSREPSASDDEEVVIGYGIWQRHFGGEPDVLGRVLYNNGQWPLTVVGVMPPGFAFPNDTELWISVRYGESLSPSQRAGRYRSAIGRLRAGSTLGDARTEATAISAQLAAEYPASNSGWTLRLDRLDDSIVGSTRPLLIVLLGLVTCVLMIACANVAGLMVARATARRHEVAVRTALGAGQRRLVRQWLVEASMLAALGGIAGVFVAWSSQRALIATAPADIPRLGEVAFGGPVLFFALAITAATALVTGLTPLFHTRPGAAEALRSRSGHADRGSVRARELLLGGQAALTFVLLVAATLLLRSFLELRAVDLGFRRENVLAVQLSVPGSRFAGDAYWYERTAYYERLIDEVRALPGVAAVEGTTDVPLAGVILDGTMWRADAPGARANSPPASAADRWNAAIRVVTPGYFELLGIPVLRGRPFGPSDRFTAQELAGVNDPRRPAGVALINQAMADRFWPGQDPLGQDLVVFEDQPFASSRRIVGIVGDVRANAVAEAAAPTVFLPFAQHPGRGLALLLHSTEPPQRLQATVIQRLRAFDTQISISSVLPLREVVAAAVSRPRFSLVLAGSFALLALGLAGIGIFGLVAYLAARRTNEIGVRLALGATPAHALRLVLSDGLRPILLGGLIGGLASTGVAAAMRSLLFGLAPLDPASYAAAAAALVVATALAALGPARSAARVDPMRVLRND